MRIVNGVLCALFVVFVGVQYNDPDFLVWAAIYAVPAVWAGLAAARPAPLLSGPATFLLGFCLGAAVFGTVEAWPSEPGFWRQEVWWESETAREGMGMMIVTLGLLVVAFTRWRLGGRPSGGGASVAHT